MGLPTPAAAAPLQQLTSPVPCRKLGNGYTIYISLASEYAAGSDERSSLERRRAMALC